MTAHGSRLTASGGSPSPVPRPYPQFDKPGRPATMSAMTDSRHPRWESGTVTYLAMSRADGDDSPQLTAYSQQRPR